MPRTQRRWRRRLGASTFPTLPPRSSHETSSVHLTSCPQAPAPRISATTPATLAHTVHHLHTASHC
jgi:hypothetical protein